MSRGKRRVRPITPLMLYWTKRDQKRFIDGVERFLSAVNDLVVVVDEAKRIRPARRTAAKVERNGDTPATTDKGVTQ